MKVTVVKAKISRLTRKKLRDLGVNRFHTLEVD